MSKIFFLISIIICSFLLPTTAYSSAVPTTITTQKQSVKAQKRAKKQKKRKQRKRRKQPHKENYAGLVIFTLIFALLIPLTGLVLFIVGLALQIPGLWIAGVVILGVVLLIMAISGLGSAISAARARKIEAEAE